MVIKLYSLANITVQLNFIPRNIPTTNIFEQNRLIVYLAKYVFKTG